MPSFWLSRILSEKCKRTPGGTCGPETKKQGLSDVPSLQFHWGDCRATRGWGPSTGSGIAESQTIQKLVKLLLLDLVELKASNLMPVCCCMKRGGGKTTSGDASFYATAGTCR